MNNRPLVNYSEYFLSLMQSVLLHTCAFGFLFLSMDAVSGHSHSQVGQMLQQAKPEIVQAVAIDEQQVVAEVQRLEQEEEQKKAMVHKAEIAKQDLQQLKIKQEKIQQQEKQKLADLKLQMEKERDVLKALQQKKEKQKKELQTLSEQKKQEQERLQKLQEKQHAEEKKRAEQQKAQDEKRAAAQKAQERQALLAARQSFLSSERHKYMALVKQKIDSAWIRPGEADSSLVCEVEIKVLPDGSVVGSKVVSSSGNFAFDRATEAAITRASPLPMPKDKDLVEDFRHFKLSFRQPDYAG